MTAFRWTRAALKERGEEIAPARQVEDPEYETMSAYFERMRRHRAARAVQAVNDAGKLDALPRPLKPPQRKQT